MRKYILLSLLFSFAVFAVIVQARLLTSVSESEGVPTLELSHPILVLKGLSFIGYPLADENDVSSIKKGYNVDFLEYTGGEGGSFVLASKLQPGKAYYVGAADDYLLDFYGPLASFTKLALKKGWNAFSPPTYTSFNKVLGSCKGKLDDENNVIGVGENLQQSPQSLLEPGKGYWIFVKNNCELDFSKAQVDVVTPSPGKIEQKSFYSSALGRNMEYSIYLPSSYSTGKTYPVVYVFVPAGGFENMGYGKFGEQIKDMTSQGDIQEMIFVAPDIENSALENGCSGWSVSPKEIGTAFKVKTGARCGNYEDYIVQDLMPYIENTYLGGLVPKEVRGLIGFGNGGTGAMGIAFDFPDKFSFVASHAGNFRLGIGKATAAYSRGLKIPEKEEVAHMKIRIVAPYTCLSSCAPALQLHQALDRKGIKNKYVKKFTWHQAIPLVDLLTAETIGFFEKTVGDSIKSASEKLSGS